ncbi:MAG: TlpA family protein disulfide reductase [Saprospiraceae bacterium]|jgi:thiol-disulfide isomerase/thioredoxin|nr:TlpA family protein disulfide reductase [Saprospiraceae bacterium]
MKSPGLPVFLLIALAMAATSCFKIDNTFTGLAPGSWRATLELEEQFITHNPKGKPLPEKLNWEFEEVTKGELPFVFEVIYTDDSTFHLEIINGPERIKVEDIHLGRDLQLARDTIYINFPIFDSHIQAFVEENLIEGEWVVRNRTMENGAPYVVPFLARHGQNHRFTTLKKPPVADISGKWEVDFEVETDHPFKGIAEFQQDGNELTGTFLTETGDYRYLEGTVQANKIYLSCFDGSHAYLFEGKIQEDGSLIGSYAAGIHYQTLWTGKKNENFELRHPDSLTFLKPGYDKFAFSFEDANGQVVSLEDERFRGKVTLVQLMGTWCPNCRDETTFLVDYIQKNPELEFEVVALAFERQREKEKAIRAINIYREKFQMDYPILLAGNEDKNDASEVLPMLNTVVAFPTLIIMDKKGAIRRIHTGFSGPATSTYESFTREFDQMLRDLIAEP